MVIILNKKSRNCILEVFCDSCGVDIDIGEEIQILCSRCTNKYNKTSRGKYSIKKHRLMESTPIGLRYHRKNIVMNVTKYFRNGLEEEIEMNLGEWADSTLVTEEEFADIMRVKPRTVRSWRNARAIEWYRVNHIHRKDSKGYTGHSRHATVRIDLNQLKSKLVKTFLTMDYEPVRKVDMLVQAIKYTLAKQCTKKQLRQINEMHEPVFLL